MIAVTGATGHLGRLVVRALLERGVPGGQIIAMGRSIERIGDLAEQGVLLRRVDYDDAQTVRDGLAGARRVLLISGAEVGHRVGQHADIIAAAIVQGTELVAYTSLAHADRSGIGLAADHVATEQILADSGMPHVLLRNGWYLENYTAQIPAYLEHGAIYGCAGDGRVSAALRADYAQAAAVVMTSEDQAGRVYELGGDEGFTMAELAAAASHAWGRGVEYRDMSGSEYAGMLIKVGLPESFAESLADADLGIARGDLHVDSRHLSMLLGRPTTRMQDAVSAAVEEIRNAGHTLA
jgi:NAD(P)H dehydrogenase (quinone)